MIKAIFIVAGHSTYNPWAEFNWIKERELVKVIAENLLNKLKPLDIDIYLSWIQNTSLENKIEQINNTCVREWYNLDNSIVLEIHTNSTSEPNIWSWIETLIYDWFKPWIELASYISYETAKTTWLSDRLVKPWKKFKIINSTIPLAWIVECWFINTDTDRKVLIHDINKFSNWIYNWLKEYIWFEDKIKKPTYEQLEKDNKRLSLENKFLNQRMDKIKLFANMEFKDNI